jgi:hypothetical protein
MKNSKHSLIATQFLLIPREPVLDFGTIEPNQPITPQTFTVELAPDVKGTVTTDADFLLIKPTTFTHGQTTIHVSPIPERLQKGKPYQAQITVIASGKWKRISIRVNVRRYNDQEIEQMMGQIESLQKWQGEATTQLAVLQKRVKELQERLQATQQLLRPKPDPKQKVQRQSSRSEATAKSLVGEQHIKHLVQSLRHGKKASDFAMEALVKIGDSAVPILIQFLNDETYYQKAMKVPPGHEMRKKRLCKDAADRCKAVQILGKIGTHAAVYALIQSLKSNNYWVGEVAKALGEIGDPAAIDALIECMAKGYEAKLCSEALQKIEAKQRSHQ